MQRLPCEGREFAEAAVSSFYCGTSGFSYKHWRGCFYPAELSAGKWLEHYCKNFTTVELNNPFYRLPEKSTFEKWRDRAPEAFVYAVKASRYLTHIKKLHEPEEALGNVLNNSSGLGDKLGPILYQFPPHWRMDLPRLEAFLKLLPRDLRHVFEFRDNSWQNEEVWAMLSKYSSAYCIMDSPGLPLHLKTTTNFTYIRMHHGAQENAGGNYTDQELFVWAERIQQMLETGDVYVYFNNDPNCYAVHNAWRLKDLVGQVVKGVRF